MWSVNIHKVDLDRFDSMKIIDSMKINRKYKNFKRLRFIYYMRLIEIALDDARWWYGRG